MQNLGNNFAKGQFPRAGMPGVAWTGRCVTRLRPTASYHPTLAAWRRTRVTIRAHPHRLASLSRDICVIAESVAGL
jgi:hypothetical protein